MCISRTGSGLMKAGWAWGKSATLAGVLTVLITVAGCNSGSSSSGNTDVEDNTSVVMIIGQSHEVVEGSRLWASSPEPAEVAIEHDFTASKRQVTLLAGEAELAL